MVMDGMIRLAEMMRDTGHTRRAAAVKLTPGISFFAVVWLNRSTGRVKTSLGITSGASSSVFALTQPVSVINVNAASKRYIRLEIFMVIRLNVISAREAVGQTLYFKRHAALA